MPLTKKKNNKIKLNKCIMVKNTTKTKIKVYITLVPGLNCNVTPQGHHYICIYLREESDVREESDAFSIYLHF